MSSSYAIFRWQFVNFPFWLEDFWSQQSDGLDACEYDSKYFRMFQTTLYVQLQVKRFRKKHIMVTKWNIISLFVLGLPQLLQVLEMGRKRNRDSLYGQSGVMPTSMQKNGFAFFTLFVSEWEISLRTVLHHSIYLKMVFMSHAGNNSSCSRHQRRLNSYQEKYQVELR